MMDHDQENWAIASTLLTEHGDDAPLHVAARLGALMIAEDMAGIERWKAIARCMEQLMNRGTDN
jgi:hypothetical protein